jgi:hypothetical protein
VERLRTLLATSALGAALVASGFAEAQTGFGGMGRGGGISGGGTRLPIIANDSSWRQEANEYTSWK